MKREAEEFFPARRKDLIVRDLADEMTLYDGHTNRAHCLNQTAAAVWRLCDGQKSVAEIARVLELDSNEELVWATLRNLNESELLENQLPPTIEDSMLSRRDLVKKVGVGMAVALPVITSVLVPPPVSAQSGRRFRKAPSGR